MITRRFLLPLPLVLWACAKVEPGLGQALADLRGAINVMKAEAPIIARLFPKLICAPCADPTVFQLATLTNPEGTGWLDLASKLMDGITEATPGAIDNARQALDYVTRVLGVLSSVARQTGSPDAQIALVAGIIEALIVLLPEVEHMLNPPSTAPLKLARMRAASAPRTTPDQARVRLNLPKR